MPLVFGNKRGTKRWDRERVRVREREHGDNKDKNTKSLFKSFIIDEYTNRT